ncbi:hypothetical protein CU002_1195 [Enterococcus faecium]|nr:hypothetical protein [Enterococcus faecium]
MYTKKGPNKRKIILSIISIWQAFFFNKRITFQLFGSFFIDYLC